VEPRSRSLIVNADDLGMSEAVTRGILEAFERGVVRSASAFVTCPAAPAGIAAARRTAPGLALGLHVDLSFGHALGRPAEHPGLVRMDGSFRPALEVLALRDSWVEDAIAREIRRQILRFEAIAWRLPDHLDAHQHLAYLNPQAFAALARTAVAFELPIRSPLAFADPTRFRPIAERLTERRGVPSEWLRDLPDEVARVLRAYPALRFPRMLETRFSDAEATPATLMQILGGLEEGTTELMCHPGFGDGDVASGDPARERELDVLTSPAAREWVKAAGATLATFGDVGRA
jgi:chitin disaccharide deacetylase